MRHLKQIAVWLLITNHLFASSVIISGGGSGGTWGSITGTLANQTDLTGALNSKLPKPPSSTDNAIPRWDGSTGSSIQNSGVVIDDSNNLSGIGSTVQINTVSYVWPGAQGAADTVLKNNGSGTLSWGTVASGGNFLPLAPVSTDNAIARWDGSTGSSIQNSTQVTIADTGRVNIAPTGNPSGFLNLDLNSSTSPTTGMITYTSGNIPSSLSHIDNMSGLTLPGGTNAMILRRTSANGGSYSAANAYIMGNYITVDTTHVGKNLGVYDSANQGVYGVHSTVSAGSSGGARGILAVANSSNYVIGGTFAGILPTGSSPQSYGVRAYATGENSAQQVGGFFRIYTVQNETNEIRNPGMSAALISDSGDTVRDSFVAMNNGSSVMHVASNGVTVLGPIGTTNRTHRINGTVVAHSGSGTPVLQTGGNAPVTGDPATWLKININGTNYVIPAWTAP